MAYPTKPTDNYSLRDYDFAVNDVNKLPMDEYLFKNGYKNAVESEVESVPDAHEQNWLFDILHRNLRYVMGVAEENKNLLSGKVATNNTLGQVKIKEGLTITTNGELSVNTDIRNKVATIPTLRNDIDSNSNRITENTSKINTNTGDIGLNTEEINKLKQEDVNINNRLLDKANRDLSNCTLLRDIYPVIQSVNSGSSNYKIFSDKSCIQAGVINFTSTTQNLIFPKPFRDTNYFLILTDRGSSRVSYGYSNTNKTYATCYCASSDNSASYIAIGYVD